MWLRLLVGQLVQQAATQKMRSVVTDTLRTELTEQPQQELPPHCDLLFVFATNAEAGALADALEHARYVKAEGFVFRYGKLANLQVVVAEVGTGQITAAQGTAALVAMHHPRRVIAAGYAVGLTTALKKGHLLLADAVCDASGRVQSLPLSLDRSTLAPSLHVGKLLSIDQVPRSPAEKHKLAEQTQAIACDMESLAVATVCRAASIECLIVRVIAETVDDALAPELERMLSQTSLLGKIGSATGAILNRFSAIGEMWQLYEDGLKCSQRLARFLQSLLAQLPG